MPGGELLSEQQEPAHSVPGGILLRERSGLTYPLPCRLLLPGGFRQLYYLSRWLHLFCWI